MVHPLLRDQEDFMEQGVLESSLQEEGRTSRVWKGHTV